MPSIFLRLGVLVLLCSWGGAVSEVVTSAPADLEVSGSPPPPPAFSSSDYNSHDPTGHQPATVTTAKSFNNGSRNGSDPVATPTIATDQDNDTTATGTPVLPATTGYQSEKGDSETSATTETVSMKTTTNEQPPVAIEADRVSSDTAGYIILVLILVMVVALSVILYFLRKNTRKYSFDLQRPGHDHDTTRNILEQSATFGNITSNHGGLVSMGEEDLAETNLSNGSTQQTDGQTDGGSLVACPSQLSLTSLTLALPIKKVGFNLDIDLSDCRSGQSCASSVLEIVEAELQNENNNNGSTGDLPAGTSDPKAPVGIFTEISLDESAP